MAEPVNSLLRDSDWIGTPSDALRSFQQPFGWVQKQYSNSLLSDWADRLRNTFSPTERAIRNADPMGYQGPEVAEEALRRWRNDQIEQGAADRIRRDRLVRRPDDEGPSRSGVIEQERGLAGPLKWSDNAGNQNYLYGQLPEGPASSYGQGVKEDRKVYDPDDIANFRAQYNYGRFGGPDPQYDSGDQFDELGRQTYELRERIRNLEALRRQQGNQGKLFVGGGGAVRTPDGSISVRNPDGSIYSRGKDYAIGSDYAADQHAWDQLDEHDRRNLGIIEAMRRHGYTGPGQRESTYVEERPPPGQIGAIKPARPDPEPSLLDNFLLNMRRAWPAPLNLPGPRD